jgi:hypothetical protein
VRQRLFHELPVRGVVHVGEHVEVRGAAVTWAHARGDDGVLSVWVLADGVVAATARVIAG